MEIRKLTQIEKESLKSQHKAQRDKRICDRIKAVLLYDKGYTYEQIAEILLLTKEAVRQHIMSYSIDDNLQPQNGGSISKLTVIEQQELTVYLETNNYVYAKDIADYIKKKYNTSYTVAGVIKLLHKLGFNYKKPVLVPGKLDFLKQEAFKQIYSSLKDSLAENEAIYFMDSVHPQYQTRARCGWIRKNTNKTLPSFSGWKRKHIIGAINLSNLKITNTDNPRVNGDQIIEFLKKLELENPDKEKIYLICDNAGYHRAKKVKEYLQNKKIELIFLPPYSPNLNPIERLWKFMHRIVSNNKFYENFEQFNKSLDDFFINITKYKDQLATLINDNFQTVKIDHFVNSSG